jgi:hypothetical protein
MSVKETEKKSRLLQLFNRDISWFYYILLQPFICIQLLFQQEHIQLLYERTYCIFSFSLSKAGLDKITRL